MSDYYYYSYPYQSSWLYSGLHSIINPVPYIKEEVNVDEKLEIRQPTCKFCYDNQKSFDCLFYQSTEPVFVKQEVRFSKIEQKDKVNVCVCCDYSTDEEDLVDSKDENKDQNDKSKVQAGWFGKGFKKARYRKK
ncbi:hypothetical protein WA026_018938 [Henosepilachna vigintioctopunctata]|uniref:Uncharacterized protein n=1 Tax=Henosepilachna vigintioctopunctata TaxID=420089 RepID=A0AAW1UQ33_9CUCU